MIVQHLNPDRLSILAEQIPFIKILNALSLQIGIWISLPKGEERLENP